MLKLDCCNCGPRNEEEFVFICEAGVVRPAEPSEASDEEWANYLYYRNNVKGPHYEIWQHRYGCRAWLRVARNTLTHEVLGTWSVDKEFPSIEVLAKS